MGLILERRKGLQQHEAQSGNQPASKEANDSLLRADHMPALVLSIRPSAVKLTKAMLHEMHMCPRTACCSTHIYLPNTHEHFFVRPSGLRNNNGQPGQLGEDGATNPATHTTGYTTTHTPSLWISVSCPLLGPSSHACLVCGHAGPEINVKVPTCIYARKVFAEPAALSRLRAAYPHS